MRWRGAHPGPLNAIGVRGDYQIMPGKRDRLGWIFWLKGTGHDGLPFLATGGDGRPFPTISSAQEFADRLDHAHGETQVSGC